MIPIYIFERVDKVVRRGGRKVADHWISVAERFIQIFNSDEQSHIDAAIAHDAVEDGYATVEELRKWGVSEETIRLVELLTHDPSEPYSDYINKIRQNKIATQIKICDIIDNLSDQPTLKQINKYSQALFLLTFERDIVE